MSTHRLQHGLPGYLIPFAPLAFANCLAAGRKEAVQNVIVADAGSTVELFELNLRADGRGGQGDPTADAGDGFGGTEVSAHAV